MKKNNDNISGMNDTTNREKFEKLYKQSRSKLYGIALSVARDADLANDVLQLAYLKAWRNFDEYDQNKKFLNWMTTIVRNAGIDQTRQKKKHNLAFSIDSLTNPTDDNKYQEMYIEDKSSDIMQNYERKELMQAIQKEISKMPEELKLVFIPFVKGLTYEEISQETNVTLATVRARVHRAKQILRNNENLENLASF
jgi:RNA polymerase sigma-70 factor (ECF subfamily)